MNVSPQLVALVHALINSPSICIVIVGLNLVGVILQTTPAFPNRFNWVIPWLLYAGGIVLTVLFMPYDAFPKGQPHPAILASIIGLILGYISWVVHDWPVQWVLAKYFPSVNNKQQTTNSSDNK